MKNNGFEEIQTGSWYTWKSNGEDVTITGYDPMRKIQVGSRTLDSAMRIWEVSEISRRNHDGTFVDPKNAVDSFYTAKIIRV